MYITSRKSSFNNWSGLGKGGVQLIPLPDSKYGLAAQTFPGIPELQQYGAAEQQEAEAGKINSQIKQQILMELNRAEQKRTTSPVWGEVVTELKNILAEMEALRALLANNMFKEAPLVPAFRKAQEIVLEKVRPGGLDIEEEEKILNSIYDIAPPNPSFITRNFMPLIIGGGSILLGVVALFLFLRD